MHKIPYDYHHILICLSPGTCWCHEFMSCQWCKIFSFVTSYFTRSLQSIISHGCGQMLTEVFHRSSLNKKYTLRSLLCESIVSKCEIWLNKILLLRWNQVINPRGDNLNDPFRLSFVTITRTRVTKCTHSPPPWVRLCDAVVKRKEGRIITH